MERQVKFDGSATWCGQASAGRRWAGLGAIALVTCLVTAAGGCGARWGSNRAVARVGQRVITERDLATAMVYSRGPAELIAMIDEVLIRQEANHLGLTASPDQVRSKLTEISSYLGSRQALENRTKELGLTMDEVNRRAETQALLDALVRRSIEIDKKEIARYYEAHRKQFRHGPRARARMMLFRSRESAEAVMTALKAGGDFAGLAKALSEDPATASDGGDMGWFEADDYAPPISKMAFSLKPGQISPVFHGPDGWYILKLEGKQPPSTEPLEKVAERIRARLVQERMLTARAEWLRERRKQAKIAIDDPRLDRAVRAQLETTPPAPALPGLMTPDQMILTPPTPGPASPGTRARAAPHGP